MSQRCPRPACTGCDSNESGKYGQPLSAYPMAPGDCAAGDVALNSSNAHTPGP